MKRIPKVIWLIVIVRVLFVISFSPNVGGDGINYLLMLTEAKSNLVHASGYPFLMGVAWWNPAGAWFIRHHPAVFLYILVLIQHAISVVALWLMSQVLSRIFGDTISAAATVLAGIHPAAIASTSHTYPEWLQADLLVFSLVSLFRAYEANSVRKKQILYMHSSFLMAWCFLVKYNAVVFLPWIVIVILIDGTRVRQRLCSCLAVAAIGIAVVGIYKATFHKRTTGTYSLSYDRGWVLLTKLRYVVPDGTLDPRDGPNTKRLLLLNSLLPWDNKNVGPIPHINYVSPETASYREKYLYILTADDRTLDSLLTTVHLRERFDFFTAFSPTTYYLGLPEGDALGVNVFVECVLAHPIAYARSVLTESCRDLFSERDKEVFPTRLDPGRFAPIGWGFYSFDQSHLLRNGTDPYSNPYGYFVWKPGVWGFRWLMEIHRIVPKALLTLLCGLYAFFAIRDFSVRRNPRDFVYLTLAVGTLGFILISDMVLHFRWHKEQILVLPLLCTMVSVSVLSVPRLWRPDWGPRDPPNSLPRPRAGRSPRAVGPG